MRKLGYFETLPVRPQPIVLESLTSYLIRLAEASGICHPSTFSALFAEEPQLVRRHIRRTDFPLLSFGAMPKVIGCSQSRLQALTFYHLGRKFGRSVDMLCKDRFLPGTTATHLRYCPHCLQESAHYPLIWRFRTLPGCARHVCRFLERCGSCGEQLPLFGVPLKMALCPACGRDLRLCRTEPLTEEEQRSTGRHGGDLQFLLTFHACEDDPLLVQGIGAKLRHWRRGFGLSSEGVAHRLGVTIREVLGSEGGALKQPNARFSTYIKYAELFNLPLSHLFPSR